MPNLTQVEVNSIREVVACHQTMSSKLSNYAEKCQDQQIKQMFKQASTEADKSAHNLLQML